MEVISFILHAKIRSKTRVRESLVQNFEQDYKLRFYETRAPRDAEGLAVQALEDGCDYLVAVGGDGTLNEVVNGYLHGGGREKYRTRLAVLPFGTGNDFARGIGMSRSVELLDQIIRQNKPIFIDAGSLAFTREDGSGYLRYFDNISDLGIGAQVVAHVNGVHLRKKILGGTLTFFISVLFTFITYRHKKIRVVWDDGQTFEGPVLGLVVANGKYFGSGFGIAPDARLDDGKLELVILARVSILDYIRNFGRLRNAQRVIHPEVHYFKADQIHVEPDGHKVVIEADGEIEGHAPLRFSCIPGALPFLMPGIN
jgi:YegS/Rv2252/BmrU family lipid kinase